MPLSCLFLDLNSYFASCEQQLTPSARGKPLVVVATDTPAGCCIAASIEAKRLGIKTGMRLGEARAIFPGVIAALSRPTKYVEFHHQIIAAVESVLPVEAVHSIDEMSCRLLGDEQLEPNARALAEKVRRAIRHRAGECLRCSIGLAPNRFLAKVATDMMKPDGLVIINNADLPHKLFALNLIDLPGIGKRMLARLHAKGIRSVEHLCSLSEAQMLDAWESVLGRYWFLWLRGQETDDRPTVKRSIGHQHVLPPTRRNDPDAWAIALRLLHKAAERMRHLGYWTQRLSLSIGLAPIAGRGPDGTRETPAWGGGSRRSWHATQHFHGGCQDTLTLASSLRSLWASRPAGCPNFVDVTLSDLIRNDSVTQPLFPELQQRAKLAQAMDQLSRKFGRHAVYIASMHVARNAAVGGIAFRSIPDLNLADTVQDRTKDDHPAA
jgi:DNA polymerase-4